MGERPAYRKRPDGVIEIYRGPAPGRELRRSAAVALGGLVVLVTLVAAVGWRAGDAHRDHTSGRLSVCWNWSAGVPTGCWTR
jgi:hypothetical protein